MEPEYAELTILTHPEAVDGLTDVLLAAGAKGVAEERRPLQVRLTAYLERDQHLEERVREVRQRLSALEGEGVRIGPGTISIRTVEAKAWSEAWRDQFQALRVTPGLVIVPSWEDWELAEGEVAVTLDPGAAFGTGGHATTRLCLRALVQHIRLGVTVADVGCGSGILAIAAAMLGAGEIVATDTDRTALPVAQANARRNGVVDRIRFLEADLLSETPGPFGLVVCNIVAEEVIRLAGGFPGLLSKGGCCVASGFVTASLPLVEDALAAGGLRILETPSEEGWAACVAVRPERA